jgi:hypothetical protein
LESLLVRLLFHGRVLYSLSRPDCLVLHGCLFLRDQEM